MKAFTVEQVAKAERIRVQLERALGIPREDIQGKLYDLLNDADCRLGIVVYWGAIPAELYDYVFEPIQ